MGSGGGPCLGRGAWGIARGRRVTGGQRFIGGGRVAGGWRLGGDDGDLGADAGGAGSDVGDSGDSESPPQPTSAAARHPRTRRREGERTDMTIPP